MIKGVIDAFLRNRFLVLIATSLVVSGIWVLKNIPLDAIPDLSDVQVIVFYRISGTFQIPVDSFEEFSGDSRMVI